MIIKLWKSLLGYSSGSASAGGQLLGDEPTIPATIPATLPDHDDLSQQVEPEKVNPAPAPLDQPPAPGPVQAQPAVVENALEIQMKERMNEHAKRLEKEMIDDFLQRKRKAELELEEELDMKRQKRIQDFEAEIQETKAIKMAELDSLDMQLRERMQLVIDEQSQLDDLKQMSRDMNRKLEEEATKLALTKKQAATAAELQQTPRNAALQQTAPEDAKSALKEKLKEKLAEKNTQLSTTPQPRTVPQTTPPSSVETAQSQGSGQRVLAGQTAVVPVTDMRFTSSTHPAAWQFLYRLTRREDQCDKSIYEAWHAGTIMIPDGLRFFWCAQWQFMFVIYNACMQYKSMGNIMFGDGWYMHVVLIGPGGPKRDHLLRDFVCRCYSATDDFSKNKACHIFCSNVFQK